LNMIKWNGEWYSIYRTHEDSYEVWDNDSDTTFFIDKLDVTENDYQHVTEE